MVGSGEERGIARTILRGFLDLFLPASCPLCGGATDDPEGGFCPSCRSDIAPISEPFCPVCALPFEGSGPSHPCGQCLRRPPPFLRVAVAGRYEGTLRKAVQGLKYGKKLWLRRPLEEAVAGVCRSVWGEGPAFSCVAPVPCHPVGMRRRGFDLPALLARRAAEELRVPFRPLLLEKVREEVRMAGLGLRQRRAAVRGLYRAREAVSGPVLLVDDVVTTTHTLRASARALRGAGAEAVCVAALARTPIAPMRN